MSFFFVQQVVAVAKAFGSENASLVAEEFRKEVRSYGRGNVSDFRGQRLYRAFRIDPAAAYSKHYAFEVAAGELARHCPKECAGCHKLTLEVREVIHPSTLGVELRVGAGCESRHPMECPATIPERRRFDVDSFHREYLNTWPTGDAREPYLPSRRPEPPEPTWQSLEIGLEFEDQRAAVKTEPMPSKPATPTDLVW